MDFARAAPPAGISVEVVDNDNASWDAFVRRTSASTLFHRMAWRHVLEETFQYRARYLTARQAGEIIGVLPLFELGRARQPRCLLSLPFAVEAGICSDHAEARQQLADAAIELAAESNAGYVELRDTWDSPGFLAEEGQNFRFRRSLHSSDAENLACIPRKQRRMVRVGQNAGLQSRLETDGTALLHDLAAYSMQRLGSPVFPRRYFESLRRHLGDDCEILSVWHDSTPVAAVMSFYFRDTVMPYYSGSRREFFGHAINDFLYWEMMRRARARGATQFDFGRSRKGSGAYHFKRHWGFTPEPMRHRVCVRGGAAPSSSTTTSLGLARSFWRHLPLPLTKQLGPVLMKYLGVYYT